MGVSRRSLLVVSLAPGVMPSFACAEAAGRDVAVFGDSQAQGLTGALQRATRAAHAMRVQDHTRPGTSISQPRVFDWPASLHEYAPDPGVGTAVMMFGGNDHLPMHPAPGATLLFAADGWRELYRNRAADMLQSIVARGLRVFWVGNPICRDQRYSDGMRYINGVYQEVVRGTPATYVDIWTAVADEGGHYAGYGKTLTGVVARLRTDDGIHFTAPGYDIVAARVLQAMAA